MPNFNTFLQALSPPQINHTTPYVDQSRVTSLPIKGLKFECKHFKNHRHLLLISLSQPQPPTCSLTFDSFSYAPSQFTMEGKAGLESTLPPGFRFHPTDEELILCYLRNRVTSNPYPLSIISDVDIYKFNPWDLPEKAEYGEREWYFFSPRDRKYPNGARPNRAAASGYWKATGTDKPIYSGPHFVGVKKALVFYKGRPPKGVKTDWIMHEYRLADQHNHGAAARPKLHTSSMRLDDWVLCRIYRKKSMEGGAEVKQSACHEDRAVSFQSLGGDHASEEQQQQPLKFPRPPSFVNLIGGADCMGMPDQLLPSNPFGYGDFSFPISCEDSSIISSSSPSSHHQLMMSSAAAYHTFPAAFSRTL